MAFFDFLYDTSKPDYKIRNENKDASKPSQYVVHTTGRGKPDSKPLTEEELKAYYSDPRSKCY